MPLIQTEMAHNFSVIFADMQTINGKPVILELLQWLIHENHNRLEGIVCDQIGQPCKQRHRIAVSCIVHILFRQVSTGRRCPAADNSDGALEGVFADLFQFFNGNMHPIGGL